MKTRYISLTLVVVLLVVGVCYFWRSPAWRPITLSRPAFDRLLQSGQLVSGTILYDDRSPLIQVRGAFRDSERRLQRFYIKTPSNDELEDKLIKVGFTTAERGKSLLRRLYLKVGELVFAR